jgi:hypothetical protein
MGTLLSKTDKSYSNPHQDAPRTFPHGMMMACGFIDSPFCEAVMATSNRLIARLFSSPVSVVLRAMLVSGGLACADEGERRQPIAGIATNCTDCGVVRTIRELRTEREVQRPDVYTSSPQYKDTLPAELPRIGPAFSLSWGAEERPRTQIGAVGTPEMKHRYIDITYEVTVKFDDGRFALIEQNEIDDIRPGDRVIVIRKRVQKIEQ